MRKVEDIKREIQELSSEEFAELRDWVLERDWKSWDAQIATDVNERKLDKLAADAIADYRAGRAREL